MKSLKDELGCSSEECNKACGLGRQSHSTVINGAIFFSVSSSDIVASVRNQTVWDTTTIASITNIASLIKPSSACCIIADESTIHSTTFIGE